ncbi:MAG TPA: metallophosphoesterase [Woeseiaceae bacterium]|nr:metallophosphoesterase [Woeseiaceae bacterium]
MTTAAWWRGQGAVTAALRRVLLCSVLLAASAAAAAAQWRWQDVPRVVAISDVHGAQAAFVRTLEASGMLDAEGHWSGGAAQLVIAGDLLDRGANSRAAMDLVMRLEGEARDAGGRVHMLLGNHEVMNLVGDLRYVSNEEYAAFADDELAEERDYWYRQYLARAGAEADAARARAAFDRTRPPGFFAHRRAFQSDGRYGAWLLDKPLMIVIDGTVFVHGGLAPVVAELGLEGVNRGMMQRLRDYIEAMETLQDHAVLLPGDSFYDYTRILDALPADSDWPPDVALAIAMIHRLDNAQIHALDSPLWYRGTAGCAPLIESARLQPVLDALGAQRVVIGHSPTATRSVVSRLDGRVIEIDTGMLNSYYHGSGHALVIADGADSVVDEAGETDAIEQDPRLNNAGPLTADALAAILRDGELTPGAARDDGGRDVRVTSGDTAFDAVFRAAPKRGFLPELAAYRIDRMLGLYLVPVTVERSVEGKTGTVQFRPGHLSNEAERAAAGAGAGAWCPLPEQWSSMYRFDTLIYKTGRSAGQILYDRSRWQLILSGHADAFGNGRGRPPYLREVEVTMDAAWREALHSLGDERLDAELAPALDRGQLRALKRRRDALLEP